MIEPANTESDALETSVAIDAGPRLTAQQRVPQELRDLFFAGTIKFYPNAHDPSDDNWQTSYSEWEDLEKLCDDLGLARMKMLEFRLDVEVKRDLPQASAKFRKLSCQDWNIPKVFRGFAKHLAIAVNPPRETVLDSHWEPRAEGDLNHLERYLSPLQFLIDDGFTVLVTLRVLIPRCHPKRRPLKWSVGEARQALDKSLPEIHRQKLRVEAIDDLSADTWLLEGLDSERKEKVRASWATRK